MIYIFTALYCEAYIFIRQFDLVKNYNNTWLQEFYNEGTGIRLVITGTGEVAAAAAVGSVCSIYKPAQSDLLLNVGVCAHTVSQDGIFLCSKIIEKATGRTFYPDMLYRHPFCEGTIVTGMLPWNGEDDISAGNLYDMEAAAVYQAGMHFFGPHQMIFLKIVSDRGAAEDVSREQVLHLMEMYQNGIFDYISRVSAIMQENSCHKILPGQEERSMRENMFETFCADLHCSKAMRDSLEQYIWYLTLTGIDYTCVIQEMYEEKMLPCKSKREGKLCFEEFKRRLF